MRPFGGQLEQTQETVSGNIAVASASANTWPTGHSEGELGELRGLGEAFQDRVNKVANPGGEISTRRDVPGVGDVGGATLSQGVRAPGEQQRKGSLRGQGGEIHARAKFGGNVPTRLDVLGSDDVGEVSRKRGEAFQDIGGNASTRREVPGAVNAGEATQRQGVPSPARQPKQGEPGRAGTTGRTRPDGWEAWSRNRKKKWTENFKAYQRNLDPGTTEREVVARGP